MMRDHAWRHKTPTPALVTHYRSRDMLHVTASHCIRPDTSWVMPGLFNTVCNILQSPDISGHTLVMTGPRKWCWVQSPEIWEILILITAWECHNTGGRGTSHIARGSVPGREEFLCNNVRVTHYYHWHQLTTLGGHQARCDSDLAFVWADTSSALLCGHS